MPDTYGELLAELVDTMAKFDPRPDIFRRNDISRNHFHNVANPNRKSSSGDPYYCPTEWGVKLTRDSAEYLWIKTVARDCGGFFISPEDVKELNDTDPEKAIRAIVKVIGLAKNKGR